MQQGASMRKSEVVLRGGVELGPAEIGLLAEVGRPNVRVIGNVEVAILSTGNELVPHDQMPAAVQIRNSNGPMLEAFVRRAGATPINLGIARDDGDDLRRLITAGLQHDVFVLSGGVSMGVLDLVPAVLAELRVEQVFHKVRIKPGKPLLFGVWNGTNQTPSRCLVFGLPGNPVSSFVSFELFVKPAIARIAGRPWTPPHPTRPAKLSTAFQHRGDRPTYHPAVLTHSPEGLLVEPTAWKGSADLRGFVGANALIAFPAGDRSFAAGESVEILPLS
jgi:molybdopterin molybdotransferase